LDVDLVLIDCVGSEHLSSGTNIVSIILGSQYLTTEADKVQFESLIKRLYIRHLFETQELKAFDTSWDSNWEVSMGTKDPIFKSFYKVFNEYSLGIELSSIDICIEIQKAMQSCC